MRGHAGRYILTDANGEGNPYVITDEKNDKASQRPIVKYEASEEVTQKAPF